MRYFGECLYIRALVRYSEKESTHLGPRVRERERDSQPLSSISQLQ